MEPVVDDFDLPSLAELFAQADSIQESEPEMREVIAQAEAELAEIIGRPEVEA